MPQKKFEIEGVGEVLVAKRRGTKNVRISISSSRKIRISLPSYLPYGVGVRYALEKKDWIQQHMPAQATTSYWDGARIGKSYRIKVIISKASNAAKSVAIKNQEICVRSESVDISHLKQQIDKACIKALRADAIKLLGIRTDELSKKYDLSYKSLQIKKMTSRWGSCTSDKRISLSLFLIQLPWELIDYVILHELTHTIHLNHKQPFWDAMVKVSTNAKLLRKKTNTYKSVIMPQ